MAPHFLTNGRILLRLASLLLVLAVGAVPGLVPRGAGQKPAGEPARPAQKPREEEEVAPAKKPIRVEDRDPLGGTGIPGLLREAQQAKHPAVRALYARLAVPHDEVQFAGSLKELTWVEPLRRYVLPRKTVPEPVDARLIDDHGRRGEARALRPGDVAGVAHYEDLALTTVNTFLDPATVKEPPLSRLDGYAHAEKVLAEVVRYHESARERDQRVGPGWEDLDKKLRARLLVVRLEQLQALAEANQGPAATELARQLATTYPNHPEVRAAVVRAFAQHAERVLDDKRAETFTQVRQRLEELDRLFPATDEDPALRKLRARLEARAKALAAEAEQLAGKDRVAAGKLVRLAESIWPSLPALTRLRQQLQLDRVLYVGVPELPVFLSPTTASTEAERQALDLLFESLLRLVPDPVVGQAYEPVLAAAMPRLLPLGRQVKLVPDARWYREAADGARAIDEPVTATDVWKMLDSIQQKSARAQEWKDLIARATVDDALTLRLHFQQGCLNPLALLTFKVLPARYVDDPEFARRPIGSGPYTYAGREKDARAGLEYAVFRANPAYGARKGLAGAPAIREIRFYSTKGRELRADFKHERPPNLHLLLDVDGQTAAELGSQTAGLDRVKVLTLPSRRVHFLAVNHRQPVLQQESLRRALAAAIDRETILNQCFRDTSVAGPKLHHALNGPYPADSWACCNSKDLRAGLFDPDKARSWAKQAKAEGITLELKYPAGRPEVAKACAALRDQVKEHTGIELNLVPCLPAELRQAVEVDHRYQLAYFHWDHADDSYWLGPLFDSDPEAAAPGGRNFLGTLPDATLAGLFKQVMQRRDFGEVQRLTQRIHQHLDSTMPLVPLWQLDIRIAIHDQLIMPARLDPLAVFGQVERWKLK